MPEDTFGELVTYPTITCVRNAPAGKTRVTRRDGSVAEVNVPQGEGSWLPVLGGSTGQDGSLTLADACVRCCARDGSRPGVRTMLEQICWAYKARCHV